MISLLMTKRGKYLKREWALSIQSQDKYNLDKPVLCISITNRKAD